MAGFTCPPDTKPHITGDRSGLAQEVLQGVARSRKSGWIQKRMRSSKSRSRNKNNRNRNNSLGNVVNRVFDSSGPEGKVRGTPQQIIDKYNQLARDATLANDRVAAENFQQHAEHYMRMLSEAQKEQDARREQQERDNRERQAQRDRDRAQREADHRARVEAETPVQPTQPVHVPSEQPDVLDVVTPEDDTGLVETPESRGDAQPELPMPSAPEAAPVVEQPAPAAEAEAPKPARKPRAPRKKPEASGEEKPKAPRKPRAPRKKPEPKAEAPSPAPDAPAPDAAE